MHATGQENDGAIFLDRLLRRKRYHIDWPVLEGPRNLLLREMHFLNLLSLIVLRHFTINLKQRIRHVPKRIWINVGDHYVV